MINDKPIGVIDDLIRVGLQGESPVSNRLGSGIMQPAAGSG
jgi:hypothetical protein